MDLISKSSDFVNQAWLWWGGAFCSWYNSLFGLLVIWCVKICGGRYMQDILFQIFPTFWKIWTFSGYPIDLNMVTLKITIIPKWLFLLILAFNSYLCIPLICRTYSEHINLYLQFCFIYYTKDLSKEMFYMRKIMSRVNLIKFHFVETFVFPWCYSYTIHKFKTGQWE